MTLILIEIRKRYPDNQPKRALGRFRRIVGFSAISINYLILREKLSSSLA